MPPKSLGLSGLAVILFPGITPLPPTSPARHRISPPVLGLMVTSSPCPVWEGRPAKAEGWSEPQLGDKSQEEKVRGGLLYSLGQSRTQQRFDMCLLLLLSLVSSPS